IGVDTQVRPGSAIAVLEYDGHRLPFPDDRFDVVTICDVLHHTSSPEAVLNEALRVLRPGGRILIKDHIAFGPWSRLVLLVMDLVGNAPKGAPARGRYMTGPQWMAAIATANAYLEKFVWPLRIHARPWSLVARSSYQFAASIRRISPTESPVARAGA